MTTASEHNRSIIRSAQMIMKLCHRYPVSDLAKEAGLVKADIELQDLVNLLEEMSEHE